MSNSPYIQTYTACVGGYVCEGHCRYCISKLTPGHKFAQSFDERRFIAGAQVAANWGAQTFLATGKGEPLHKANLPYLERMLQILEEKDILPIRELQTNGVEFFHNKDVQCMLSRFKERYGLNILSFSAVSMLQHVNQEAIHATYPSITELISLAQNMGFTVRLNIIICRDYARIPHLKKDTETLPYILNFVNNVLENSKADQHTFRSVTGPSSIAGTAIGEWIQDNAISDYSLSKEIAKQGIFLYSLVHGGNVYLYKDRNVCVSNCITSNVREEPIRQLIRCIDNRIRTDWKYEASVLI